MIPKGIVPKKIFTISPYCDGERVTFSDSSGSDVLLEWFQNGDQLKVFFDTYPSCTLDVILIPTRREDPFATTCKELAWSPLCVAGHGFEFVYSGRDEDGFIPFVIRCKSKNFEASIDFLPKENIAQLVTEYLNAPWYDGPVLHDQ
jgi:hypothetical protein